jgi:ribosome-associated protein
VGGRATPSAPGADLSDAARPPSLPVVRGPAIPLSEVTLRTSRSSGPGGQHANVTASRVEAVFDVLSSTALSDAERARVLARVGPRLVAVAQDERSQARNRDLALKRLAERLERALAVPRSRRATAPTAASRARRLADKRRAALRKLQRRPPSDGEA